MTKKLLILLTLLLVSIPTFAQHVDTAWVRTYDGPVHEYDRLSAIAVDAYGNVYVTGESEGLSGDNYATVKYDAQGNERWVARYDGPGSWDRPYDIAVDGSGNVYVTGRSHHWVFGVDYATAKYDSSGNELWVKRNDGPPHNADYAYGLAVRDPNNI